MAPELSLTRLLHVLRNILRNGSWILPNKDLARFIKLFEKGFGTS